MDFKKVMSLLGEDTDLSKVNDILDKLVEGEKELEVSEEEVSEEVEETEEETKELEAEEEPEEETKELEVEETEEEPTNGEEEITLASVMEAINGLNDRIKSLESENTELKAQLSAKEQSEAEFIEKFKNLSVALSTEREEPVTNEVTYTDGFGG